MSGILATPIGRLRVASIADAISYLLLMGVAVPLKYLGGIPEGSMIVGSIHGGLFIALCLAILLALRAGLPFRLGLAVFLLSIVPFGPFLIDPSLKRADRRLADGPESSAATIRRPAEPAAAASRPRAHPEAVEAVEQPVEQA